MYLMKRILSIFFLFDKDYWFMFVLFYFPSFTADNYVLARLHNCTSFLFRAMLLVSNLVALLFVGNIYICSGIMKLDEVGRTWH